MRKLLLTLSCSCLGVAPALASLATEFSAVKGSPEYGIQTVWWGFAWGDHGNGYRRFGHRDEHGHRPYHYRRHGYGNRGR
jgi:hypothetical protein